jgi:Rab9 effector protein with kelch motifs
VFGGGNGLQALNDVWTLDVSGSLDRTKWERVTISGRKRPSPRGYHTANLVQNVMIVVGGSDRRECFQDIWCLNLGASSLVMSFPYRSFTSYQTHVHITDTAVWTQVKPDTLHRRLSHSSSQVGSYLFISGGHDGSEYTPELLLFNLGECTCRIRFATTSRFTVSILRISSIFAI